MTALLKTTRMTCETTLSGLAATFDLSGGLYLPDEGILIVADLHLEKGSSFARKGMMLPPYDTRETLAILRDVVTRFEPRTVIALGDSFHDVGGPARLGSEERAVLARLQSVRDWIWVTGNHDRELPQDIGGAILAEATVGPLALRHEPVAGAGPEVAGHLHPVGKVVMRGRGVRRRCFLSDGERCVMPAFGAYAGGLNACDPAFRTLFPKSFTAHLIGTDRIYAIGRALLCRD